jgi:hypothetical protein
MVPFCFSFLFFVEFCLEKLYVFLGMVSRKLAKRQKSVFGDGNANQRFIIPIGGKGRMIQGLGLEENVFEGKGAKQRGRSQMQKIGQAICGKEDLVALLQGKRAASYHGGESIISVEGAKGKGFRGTVTKPFIAQYAIGYFFFRSANRRILSEKDSPLIPQKQAHAISHIRKIQVIVDQKHSQPHQSGIKTPLLLAFFFPQRAQGGIGLGEGMGQTLLGRTIAFDRLGKGVGKTAGGSDHGRGFFRDGVFFVSSADTV